MSYAAAIDGSRIWYEVRGNTSAPKTPLVLIQGLALDHHAWHLSAPEFDDRPLIVLDHRGTGNSQDSFPDRWSTRDFAHDVIAVLDAAGIERAHVYGHSMGARIAQWIGAEHADSVLPHTASTSAMQAHLGAVSRHDGARPGQDHRADADHPRN